MHSWKCLVWRKKICVKPWNKRFLCLRSSGPVWVHLTQPVTSGTTVDFFSISGQDVWFQLLLSSFFPIKEINERKPADDHFTPGLHSNTETKDICKNDYSKSQWTLKSRDLHLRFDEPQLACLVLKVNCMLVRERIVASRGPRVSSKVSGLGIFHIHLVHEELLCVLPWVGSSRNVTVESCEMTSSASLWRWMWKLLSPWVTMCT